jgi:glycosyltransferase involved in cell wall biosynthesis
MSPPKNLLIISYHFPPDAAIGSIRPAKLSKYLPEFRWSPIILTVKDKYYEKKDESKLDEIRGRSLIVRTNKLPGIRDIYLRLKTKLARGKKQKQLLEDMLNYEAILPSKGKERGFKATIKRIIFSLFVWLPDDKLGWVPVAVFRGLRLIKKENIDMILTTSPPQSVHLAGLFLKVITGVKWAADFRDPWMIDFKKPHFVRTKLSDEIEAWMEKKVVEKADLIISTNERTTEKFRVHYPYINAAKFVTIWNGFDEEDFCGLRNMDKYSIFTITYIGTFYQGRTPKLLLKALSELVSEGKIDAKDFSIQFIGNTRYANGEPVEKMIQDLNLTGSVEVRGWMPYGEALKEMAKSHLLLLLVSDQPLQTPGKVFEYIGIGGNILAILEDGAASDLLRKYKKAVIVKGNDVPSLKKTILYFHQNYTGKNEYEDKGFIEGYERRFLTRKLAEFLNTAYATKQN